MRSRIISLTLIIALVISICSCNKKEPPDEGTGKSGYEIAVENGFQGTMKEWLDSLAAGTDTDIFTESESDEKANIDSYNCHVNQWAGKNVVAYGDSITYCGAALDIGYIRTVKDTLNMGNSYRRAVGGQTYKWNTGTWQAAEDGSYVNRGTADDNCKGSFCSWERITTSIPESIRETIDLVLVMGGTNDHSAVEEVVTDGNVSSNIPVWSAENTTDTDWISDTEYYNGGDFDVTSFSGAVASTLMKWQVWCPNAVIVLVTPLGRWDTETMQQYTANGKTLTDVAKIERSVAEYFSFPVIDVTAKTGINAFNYKNFISDGVHPTDEGADYIGKIIASELIHIPPR